MIFAPRDTKGFSLVEVLVAISMLLLVITGPMTMISRANNSTSFATEQITAFFLAQEGLELVQMQRDNFLLAHFDDPITNNTPTAAFKTFFEDCDFDINPAGCGIEVDSTNNSALLTPVNCSTLTNCRLNLDSTVSSTVRPSYRHSGADPLSLYTRVITMVFDPSGREVSVTATVTWRTGTLISTQQVSATTYLFNIYDRP